MSEIYYLYRHEPVIENSKIHIFDKVNEEIHATNVSKNAQPTSIIVHLKKKSNKHLK